MNLKTIAKIQLRVGILLFIVAVIGGVWVIQNIYLDTLIRGEGGITSVWSKVVRETDGTSIGASGHVMTGIFLEESLVKTTMYLFGACAFIVAVLGIILILQGLANLKK